MTMINPTLSAPPPAGTQASTAAAALGEALKASPEFARLTTADRAVSADPAATAAIAAFESLQREFRAEIAVGRLRDDQRARLQAAQQAVNAVPSVAAYLAAAQRVQALCRDIAAVVSAEIGVDFAANARSGGCCG